MIKLFDKTKLKEPTNEEKELPLANTEHGPEFIYTDKELYHIIKEYYLNNVKVEDIKLINRTSYSVRTHLDILREDYGDEVLKEIAYDLIGKDSLSNDFTKINEEIKKKLTTKINVDYLKSKSHEFFRL